ncbi:MAG: RNA polymerase sigma factor [Bryobacteraceae bacterium]
MQMIGQQAANEGLSQSGGWTLVRLVEGFQARDPEAVSEFYQQSIRRLRLFFRARRIDQMQAEDLAQDVFLKVLAQIEAGALQEPERLFGYMRTIALRVYAAHVCEAVQGPETVPASEAPERLRDLRKGPESQLLEQERWELARHVLASMKPREREILTRFYLYGQDPETICREMGLTATQYRLLKSRAKSRFGELGKRKLERGKLAAWRARCVA